MNLLILLCPGIISDSFNLIRCFKCGNSAADPLISTDFKLDLNSNFFLVNPGIQDLLSMNLGWNFPNSNNCYFKCLHKGVSFPNACLHFTPASLMNDLRFTSLDRTEALQEKLGKFFWEVIYVQVIEPFNSRKNCGKYFDKLGEQ